MKEMHAERNGHPAGGVVGRTSRRRRAARLRPAHAAAHVPHGRRRAGVPARPCQGAGAARWRRHPARGWAHRGSRGGGGAAARDHLRRRASAGAHRLAPRQPASRHRDRRPGHPYPRRSRDRRHGARPRRQCAGRRAAVQPGGRSLRRGRGARAQPWTQPQSRAWPPRWRSIHHSWGGRERDSRTSAACLPPPLSPPHKGEGNVHWRG